MWKRRDNRLHVGSRIPDEPSHLVNFEGENVPLVDDEKITLVCFLRHLAWLPWQDHVKALLSHIDELKKLGCRIIFVSFCDPAKQLHRNWIEGWCNNNIAGMGTSVLLLLDPTKSAYRSWSIPSSQVAAWGPSNFWYYTKAIWLRGQRRVTLQGEAGQLGADFVLSPGDGKVLLQYYCKNPTDRVAIQKLLDTARLYRKTKTNKSNNS